MKPEIMILLTENVINILGGLNLGSIPLSSQYMYNCVHVCKETFLCMHVHTVQVGY